MLVLSRLVSTRNSVLMSMVLMDQCLIQSIWSFTIQVSILMIQWGSEGIMRPKTLLKCSLILKNSQSCVIRKKMGTASFQKVLLIPRILIK